MLLSEADLGICRRWAVNFVPLPYILKKKNLRNMFQLKNVYLRKN